MKKKLYFRCSVILTASSFIAVSATVDEVKSAIKNLADKQIIAGRPQSNQVGGQGRFAPGPLKEKPIKAA
jgi:hypothetical protein